MALVRRWKTVCLAFAWAGLVIGCGPSTPQSEPTPTEQTHQALQEVGELYRMYVVTHKKAPTSIADFAGSQTVAPLGYQKAKDGSVTVLWGALLTDTSEEGSKDSAEEILAYEKKTPEQGGEVLMKNRTIKTMTAEEFKAAPKAGTTSPATATATKAK